VSAEKKRGKEDQLDFDKKRTEMFSKEDLDLIQYMKTIGEEPWAKGNPRLQKYISDTVAIRPQTGRAQPVLGNTRER
jgi:hypothetical protein